MVVKMLKGFFSVFSVVANFRKEKQSYERSGYFIKILSMLAHLFLIGVTALCVWGAYACITAINFASAESVLFMNILHIIGAIFCISTGFSTAFKTFVTCLQISIIAFNSARKARGVKPKRKKLDQTISANASSLGEDILIDRKGANVDELTKMQANENPAPQYDDTYANQAPKTSRGFDVFYGLISLIMAAAIPVGLAVFIPMVL